MNTTGIARTLIAQHKITAETTLGIIRAAVAPVVTDPRQRLRVETSIVRQVTA